MNYYIGVHMSTHLSGSHRRNWYVAYSLALGVIVALALAKEVYNATVLRRREQVCHRQRVCQTGCQLSKSIECIAQKWHVAHGPVANATSCCSRPFGCSRRPMLEVQQCRCPRHLFQVRLATAGSSLTAAIHISMPMMPPDVQTCTRAVERRIACCTCVISHQPSALVGLLAAALMSLQLLFVMCDFAQSDMRLRCSEVSGHSACTLAYNPLQ